MKNSNFLNFMLAAFLVSSNHHVLAENAEEAVVKSCAGYITSEVIPEDSVCYEYISGFMDGAIITDQAIIDNITSENKEFSSFFQRAYKTRVGQRQRSLPATYYANFCLPEDQTRKMVIEELIHQLNEDELNRQTFKETLYSTLKRVYKCTPLSSVKED